MKAPVWHLISRVDLVGGSTGYHRFNLIDKFIHNFGEWWLVGTSDTAHWAYGLVDVANQFVAQGVRGGLSGFVSFIAVLTIAYKHNGRVLRRVRRSMPRSVYAYAIGITLLTHIAMFFGISYFGQIEVVWYATLGVIGSLAALTLRAPAAAGAVVPATAAPAPVERGGRDTRPEGLPVEKPWVPANLAEGLRGGRGTR